MQAIFNLVFDHEFTNEVRCALTIQEEVRLFKRGCSFWTCIRLPYCYESVMDQVWKATILNKTLKISHGFFGKAFGLNKNSALEEQAAFNAISHFLGTNSIINTLSQVHSSKVLVLREPLHGKKPEADALITTVPGLFIGIFTADCVPILLASEAGDMVAAVHAGWRGAFGGIIENTIALMNRMGASRIYAALGPCIWQASYEVSEEFYASCTAASFFKPGSRPGHWQFDLPGYVTDRLVRAGVNFIEASPADTYREKAHFYSFRRSTHDPKEALLSNFSAIGII